MRSTTFNFLLVALVVALVDAAPHLDTAITSPESPGAEIVGLLPEVTNRHILKSLPEAKRSVGRPDDPKRPADAPIIRLTASKQKNRRMVYGWAPKSFESGDNDQSDWDLLATRPAETSEHPTQDKKMAYPAGMNSTGGGSKGQPPAAVLKTLCDLLLSGHNSSDASASPDGAGLPSASTPAGHKKDRRSSSDGSSADKTTGLTDDAHNSTQALGQPPSMPAGAGNYSALAMTWCNQQFGDHPSANSAPHQVSTTNGDKPPASETSTVPFSAAQAPKNSPAQFAPTVTPHEGSRQKNQPAV